MPQPLPQPMDIIVTADRPGASLGTLRWQGGAVPCALGRAGIRAEVDKREGDGATPAGTYPLRRVFCRTDRIAPPETGLPVRAIAPADGWCDDPDDGAYNRLVTLPINASHERMWRDDHIYDLVVEIGHNDSPPVPGRGSAIFLHLAREGFAPTEGCVAVTPHAMMDLLSACDATTRVVIEGP